MTGGEQMMEWAPDRLALEFIMAYGGIDGGHHKAWVLDQVARALLNCPRSVEDGHLCQGESEEYKAWVGEFQGEWDEECEGYEYDYDEGVPP